MVYAADLGSVATSVEVRILSKALYLLCCIDPRVSSHSGDVYTSISSLCEDTDVHIRTIRGCQAGAASPLPEGFAPTGDTPIISAASMPGTPRPYSKGESLLAATQVSYAYAGILKLVHFVVSECSAVW